MWKFCWKLSIGVTLKRVTTPTHLHPSKIYLHPSPPTQKNVHPPPPTHKMSTHSQLPIKNVQKIYTIPTHLYPSITNVHPPRLTPSHLKKTSTHLHPPNIYLQPPHSLPSTHKKCPPIKNVDPPSHPPKIYINSPPPTHKITSNQSPHPKYIYITSNYPKTKRI